MPDDYVTAHNAEKQAQEEIDAKAQELPGDEPTHNVTKHQIYSSDGVKHVYHCDHTSGKVYVEGERGRLRFAGTNIEQVSAYLPFTEDDRPHRGYFKTVSPAGVVLYTDLGGAPFTPTDDDVEYARNPETGLVYPVDPQAIQPIEEPKKASASYQRHRSIQGATYYTDSEGNKVVKADIPEDAAIEDIEDKE